MANTGDVLTAVAEQSDRLKRLKTVLENIKTPTGPPENAVLPAATQDALNDALVALTANKAAIDRVLNSSLATDKAAADKAAADKAANDKAAADKVRNSSFATDRAAADKAAADKAADNDQGTPSLR